MAIRPGPPRIAAPDESQHCRVRPTIFPAMSTLRLAPASGRSLLRKPGRGRYCTRLQLAPRRRSADSQRQRRGASQPRSAGPGSVRGLPVCPGTSDGPRRSTVFVVWRRAPGGGEHPGAQPHRQLGPLAGTARRRRGGTIPRPGGSRRRHAGGVDPLPPGRRARPGRAGRVAANARRPCSALARSGKAPGSRLRGHRADPGWDPGRLGLFGFGSSRAAPPPHF